MSKTSSQSTPTHITRAGLDYTMLRCIRTFLTHTRKVRPTSDPNISRTYRDELYSGRRVEVMPNASGRYPTSMALTRVTELMKSEGIMERVKSKREFIRPGLKASLGRMKRRQDRFNVMVSKTISEILDMKDRLK